MSLVHKCTLESFLTNLPSPPNYLYRDKKEGVEILLKKPKFGKGC